MSRYVGSKLGQVYVLNDWCKALLIEVNKDNKIKLFKRNNNLMITSNNGVIEYASSSNDAVIEMWNKLNRK